MSDEIFSIRLSEKGFGYLKRLRGYALYLTIVAFLISISITVYYAPNVKDFFNTGNGGTAKQELELYAFLIYAVFFVVLFPLQSYYFYQFSATLKKSISKLNEDGFSQSMRWLVMYAIVCIITYTVNLLQFLVVLYLEHF